MPATSTAEIAIEAAKDLTHILKIPVPASPYAEFGTEANIALAQLSNIFSQLKPKSP